MQVPEMDLEGVVVEMVLEEVDWMNQVVVVVESEL